MKNPHDLTEEPPDADWLEEEAERRRLVGEQEKARQRMDRLARREREPLSKRLHQVEASMALATTVGAGSIAGDESGGKATPGTRIPPRADPYAVGGEDRREVARLFRVLTEAVSRLEACLDTAQGVSGPRPPMMTEDLDKLLLSYEGLTPEEVALLEPSLGSPTAVRKSRSKMKRHREDGSHLSNDR